MYENSGSLLFKTNTGTQSGPVEKMAKWVTCHNQHWKVPSSNSTERPVGLWDTTPLQSSR